MTCIWHCGTYFGRWQQAEAAAQLQLGGGQHTPPPATPACRPVGRHAGGVWLAVLQGVQQQPSPEQPQPQGPPPRQPRLTGLHAPTRTRPARLPRALLACPRLPAGQWAGTATVFGALYYKALSKKEGSGSKPKTAGIPEEPPAGLAAGTEDEKLPLVAGDSAPAKA